MKELGIAIVIAAVVAAVTLSVVEIGSGDGDLAELEVSTPGGAELPTNAQLFVSSGCAACHGASGEGGIGPPLAGHTAEQVIRQARRPLNVMPLFTPEELSDEQLDQIASFVTGLSTEGMGHEEQPEGLLDPRDEIAMHHWMALSALRAGNQDAATAHIAAVIDAVGGEHRSAMVDATAAIEAGDLKQAEATVVEMLAGFVPDLTDEQILLRLALQALVVDDLTGAIADLDAAIELADASRVDQLEAALDALRSGDTDGAEELISSLAGLPEHDAEEVHAPEPDQASDE